MSTLNLTEIEARLRAENLLSGAALSELPLAAPTPWFIRILLGFCGWLAAVFLLASLGALLHRLFSNAPACIAIGLLACAATVALDRGRAGAEAPLQRQFTLALSLAGQMLVYVGLFLLWGNRGPAYLLAVLFEVALVVVYRGELQRFLSTLVAAATATVWLGQHRIGFVAPLGFMASCCTLWLAENRWRSSPQAGLWRPVAYALVISLFGSVLYQNAIPLYWRPHDEFVIPYLHWFWRAGFLASALIWAGLLYRLWRAGERRPRASALLALGGLALVAAAYWIAGLLAAALVLILGIARGNRLLAGLALAFLAYALSRYYYDLQTTLLVKSIALMLTGLGLLLARLLLRVFAEEASHEA